MYILFSVLYIKDLDLLYLLWMERIYNIHIKKFTDSQKEYFKSSIVSFYNIKERILHAAVMWFVMKRRPLQNKKK